MFDHTLFIDTLKRRLKLKNDAALASILKIEASRISKMRGDVRPINNKVLERIHENTGIPLEELNEMTRQPLPKPSATLTAQDEVTPLVAANSRNRYDHAFKLTAVRMVSKSMPSARVAKQLKLPESTMHNWVKAYRRGELNKRVEFSAEESDYVQKMLKVRAGRLQKEAVTPQSRQEKALIAALQKKLRQSAV